MTKDFPESLCIVPPDGAVNGVVHLPGSKSITNRALLIAGLAQGESVLDNALFCDDSRYLCKALRELGVAVDEDEPGGRIVVSGAGGPFTATSGKFFLGNAGTSTRFLTAALTVCPGNFVVDGDDCMQTRPIGELVYALRVLGATIEAPSGCPPVYIGEAPPNGNGLPREPGRVLLGGPVVMGGRTSSQFISAIILAAPLATRDVEVIIEGECVSRPYIDITLGVMKHFGAHAYRDDGRADGRTSFCAAAGRGYQAQNYCVEGDASSASYFLAAAALTGGRMQVQGFGRESLQGDAQFADVLAKMGCHVKKDEDSIGLNGDLLRGIDVDCQDMPDIVPTLAVVALFARGRTRIRNVAHLRFKESDRIKSVATELRKLGGRIKELPDGLEIEESSLRGGTVETWNDHRLAMAFSIAGLRVPDIVIKDPAVVQKSFPDYFERLTQIGIEVRHN
jgi:3-phosphoshikimate 1-carboxyvinyltransferase